ncbi:M12 family metallopeptidase [Ensifer adhaerens]|uniref:M12 family metallopeptidase n=1 Tax=Ensifer adhaerens TaxID=106592 RepID=UPI00098F5256
MDGNLPNKTRVREAIAEWERSTSIRFVAANAADRSYLLFAPAQDATNCSTRVGYSGAVQVLDLGSACKRGNVAHEIARALGVAHEHMRSDQSRYISIQWANIPTGAKHNFERKPRKYSTSAPYCYGSIMPIRAMPSARTEETRSSQRETSGSARGTHWRRATSGWSNACFATNFANGSFQRLPWIDRCEASGPPLRGHRGPGRFRTGAGRSRRPNR